MNYYKTSLKRSRLLLPVVPVALALIVAGCGGGSSAQSGSGGATGASSATLRLAGLAPGKALVDAQGRTLYLFEADKGTMSVCTGGCASIWPPATTTGKTLAGPGIAAAKIGVTTRGDGGRQVTYNGHPLYRYAADAKPGDATGQGLNQFGGKWYVLSARGSKIDND